MTRTGWALVALGVIAAGVATWWFVGRDIMPSPILSPDASVMVPVAAAPDAGDEALVDDEPDTPSAPSADDRLRSALADKLAKSPGAAWVAAPGIVQRLTAAVWLVSQGKSPSAVLGFISVPEDFEVDETVQIDAPIYIADKSYDRYDRVVGALDALGPETAAKIYRNTARGFDRAFRQVAQPDQKFDVVLAEAIDRLVSVEIPTKRIEVVPKGGVFAFANDKLEALDEPEKHLLRMGPKNARAVQAFLRAFKSAANL